jgi:hypothetical protein
MKITLANITLPNGMIFKEVEVSFVWTDLHGPHLAEIFNVINENGIKLTEEEITFVMEDDSCYYAIQDKAEEQWRIQQA